MSQWIDAKGQRCPVPVVLAKKAIAAGETSFTIEVDDPAAVENLSRLADHQGFTAAVRGLPGGGHALNFTRASGVSAPTACQREADAPLPGRGYAGFVGRDIIGSGDRELGANLMRMFFYTLAEGDALPESVLFMNDGVKLPTLDDQVAAHVQTLTDRGVEVLVCGTCLSFYGLTDRLQAGTVSNMFDIVSRMQAAAKVITL